MWRFAKQNATINKGQKIKDFLPFIETLHGAILLPAESQQVGERLSKSVSH